MIKGMTEVMKEEVNQQEQLISKVIITINR